MFTSINAEQKSVPQSLLRELYAELNWEAPEPSVRAVAIVSKAVQMLDSEIESPFYHRIRKTDDSKDPSRCITLTSMCQALEKSGFYIAIQKKGSYDFGALWAFDGKNDATLKRTVYILKRWFQAIKDENIEWWDLGSAPGGGLAMSDGVTVCINVLRSVFQFMENKGNKLRHISDKELADALQDYGSALATHLALLDTDERKKFREYRGAQGQLRATRECQVGMQSLLSHFDPPGLKEFIELEGAQTNSKAQAITEGIENVLRSVVVEELKNRFGQEENQWWSEIPIAVRLGVSNRFEKDNRRLGSQSSYLELADYKSIVSDQWDLFEPLLAYGKGSKTKRLQWISEFIEAKKQTANGTKSSPLPVEKLKELEDYRDWLNAKLGSDEVDLTASNDLPEFD